MQQGECQLREDLIRYCYAKTKAGEEGDGAPMRLFEVYGYYSILMAEFKTK